MSDIGSIQGFHSVGIENSREFNEKTLSELERIINAFMASPKAISLAKFYSTLESHLEAIEDPHELDISLFSQELINTLYQYYLDQGYTGSVFEMLKSIVKTKVEVATVRETLANNTSTKAVNLTDWEALFNKHEAETLHNNLLDIFTRQRGFNIYPQLSLNYLYDTHKLVHKIPHWDYCGTINFKFCYFNSTRREIDRVLFMIGDESDALTVRYYSEAGSDEVVINLSRPKINLDKSFTLPCTIEGINTSVISFSKDESFYRDYLVTGTIPSINQGKLLSPILTLNEPLSAAHLQEITFYPIKMSIADVVPLINH